MSTSNISLPSKRDSKGSFFKVCVTLSSQKHPYKQSCAQHASGRDCPSLTSEVGGLFLQASPCAGIGGGLAGARDSGYDSLHRRLSVLDRLVHTHTVWLQLGLSHEEAMHILQNEPAGTFVVRKSASLQKKVISLRMDKDSSVPVKDFPVKESQYTFSLEGSGLSFADLFRLMAFCCISRDVLPFTLKLPEAIASARTFSDLEEVAKLGAGFWDVPLCRRRKSSVSLTGTAAPDRPPPPAHRPVSSTATSGRPRLQTRTPSELECCQANGALCFINPLFLKVHQPDDNQSFTPNIPDTGKNAELHTSTSHKLSGLESVTRFPPPRPPPPRFTAQQTAPPVRQRSMPEKICWIKEKVEERERGSSLLSRLGSSLSISPSSCPPKRLSISSPISIPRPSLPLSLPSLSSSPRRTKASPTSSLEDAQCQRALEDDTIEKALMRAKLSRQKALPSEEERVDECSGGSQRLSDMSLSTDSSDSLDFSQSSAFFMPPMHDPSPPTEDEDDEEEHDYGVSLESDQDQDQDLTMVPPGHRTKRRPSASALVLQKALRGHLRKVSGVFNSLLTPEKRAIRKVVELSRDKSSYFGSLVQDYLSYMGEGAGTQAWQGYDSGLDLLQTLRQFITQMKSYLRQSSEMEPPIESLIPEDQIDQVLEKAMHKCVLKPLKAVVSSALQEFQIRSGEWQELKENLSQAKARQPQEMGVADAQPPDTVAIEKIKHKFHTMCKLYSPEKKVSMLLRVCKLIYTIMEDNSGRLYGADDFLPMLTYVLAQCDMPQLDNEILYMMELLDPSLLHGEGGYYLTSAYGAMSLIKNFQEEQAARVLSSETRNTLHQWHRRRTTQRSAPSIDDFQNYLRVALQELDSGCTAKTLQVQPYATVEEVCQLCARKFKVSDPENYGLFLLMEGSSQQLAPDTHPQKIKAELHSRPQAGPFYFVFRRVLNSGFNGNQ
uniref:Ras and Rab interactor 2a n=1 Tax=Neolamprologus brichardi TaxID=32507 RepID=A0A3Q4HUB6_NEOBR